MILPRYAWKKFQDNPSKIEACRSQTDRQTNQQTNEGSLWPEGQRLGEIVCNLQSLRFYDFDVLWRHNVEKTQTN